jgi:O-antigen ligase
VNERGTVMRWLETGAVLALFALGMTATLYLRVIVNWRRLGVPYSAVRPLLLVLLCLALGSMLWRARTVAAVGEVLKQTPALAVLLLLALASTAWSVDPSDTLARSLMLSSTCFVSLCLGVHYELEHLLTLIIGTVALLAVATVASVLLSPGTAVQADMSGAWRGVFEHKNILGRSMLIGLLAVVLKLRAGELGRPSRFGLALIVPLVVALILLSRSATAWVLAASVVGLALYLPRVLGATTRRDHVVAIGGAVLVVLGGVVAISDPAGTLQLLGKDTTLTGRLLLWEIARPYVVERPWLGYGYGVFWEHFEDTIWRLAEWPAPHPHNGYLQLVLDLGIVGLLVFAVCLTVALYRATDFYRRDPRPTNLFPLLALFCLATVNLVETRLVKFDDFWWMLFVMIVAVTSKAGLAHGRIGER